MEEVNGGIFWKQIRILEVLSLRCYVNEILQRGMCESEIQSVHRLKNEGRM